MQSRGYRAGSNPDKEPELHELEAIEIQYMNAEDQASKYAWMIIIIGNTGIGEFAVRDRRIHFSPQHKEERNSPSDKQTKMIAASWGGAHVHNNQSHARLEEFEIPLTLRR